MHQGLLGTWYGLGHAGRGFGRRVQVYRIDEDGTVWFHHKYMGAAKPAKTTVTALISNYSREEPVFGKKSVVVLGAGPAGLLAAHAASQLGYRVDVFSMPSKDQPQRAVRSELFGCQYLHRPIPGIQDGVAGVPVQYTLRGQSDEYRRKVYGDNWDGQVSPDEFGPEQNHEAWDLRTAYAQLWGEWCSRITCLEMDWRIAEAGAKHKNRIVLSTVPAPALCSAPEVHKFLTQDVWAMGSSAYRQPPYVAVNNTVECNGEEYPRWYRAATVFGHSTLEWPMGPKPPIDGVVPVRKPLSTDCDCHLSKRWYRLGRYGQWTKGVLVHTAYEQALEVLR